MYHAVEQRSEEWFDLRLGRVTSSNFKTLMSAKSTKGYQDLVYKCVYERITSQSAEQQFTTPAMERGVELEAHAFAEYAMQTESEIKQSGFFTYGECFGSSPDGLIGDDGILEIKCPLPHTYMRYRDKRELPAEYKWQVHSQILIAEVEYADFIVYDPNMGISIVKVERDQKLIDQMLERMAEAEEEIKQIENKTKKETK